MDWRVLSVVVLAGWGLTARAQPDARIGEKERGAAKKHAEEIMRAYAGGRHARFADLTHPTVVKRMGGRDKLIGTLRAVDEKMRAAGWAYGEVAVSDPTDAGWMGKELVAVVPFSVEYVGPGGRKRKDESYLIGVSADGGKSWVFVDGRKITRENVRDVFPKFPDGVKLPTKKGKTG
jgi:hypothetical protein